MLSTIFYKFSYYFKYSNNFFLNKRKSFSFQNYFFAALNAFWHASLIALEEQVAPATVFTPSAFPFAIILETIPFFASFVYALFVEFVFAVILEISVILSFLIVISMEIVYGSKSSSSSGSQVMLTLYVPFL